MIFNIYGEKGRPTLFLLPGLGVSHEIFLPLIFNSIAKTSAQNIQQSSAGCKTDHTDTTESAAKQNQELSENRNVFYNDSNQAVIRDIIHVFTVIGVSFCREGTFDSFVVNYTVHYDTVSRLESNDIT